MTTTLKYAMAVGWHPKLPMEGLDRPDVVDSLGFNPQEPLATQWDTVDAAIWEWLYRQPGGTW